MGARVRSRWSWTRSACDRPNEAAAAAVNDRRTGQHCTDMAIDSQRAPRAQRGPTPTTTLADPGARRERCADAPPGGAAVRARRVHAVVRGADGRRAATPPSSPRSPRAYKAPAGRPERGGAPHHHAAARSPGAEASGGAARRRRPSHPDRHRRPPRPRPGTDAPLRHRPRGRVPDRLPGRHRRASSTSSTAPSAPSSGFSAGFSPARVEAVDAVQRRQSPADSGSTRRWRSWWTR